MKPFTGNITYTDGSVWDATQHIVTTHRGYYYKSPYLQRHSHNSRSTIGRGSEGYHKAMDYLESVTTKALTEKPVASIAERPTARNTNVVSWHIEGFGDISVEADINSYSDVIRLHLCYPKALGVIGGGLRPEDDPGRGNKISIRAWKEVTIDEFKDTWDSLDELVPEWFDETFPMKKAMPLKWGIPTRDLSDSSLIDAYHIDTYNGFTREEKKALEVLATRLTLWGYPTSVYTRRNRNNVEELQELKITVPGKGDHSQPHDISIQSRYTRVKCGFVEDKQQYQRYLQRKTLETLQSLEGTT